jgi:hypothetical protein
LIALLKEKNTIKTLKLVAKVENVVEGGFSNIASYISKQDETHPEIQL